MIFELTPDEQAQMDSLDKEYNSRLDAIYNKSLEYENGSRGQKDLLYNYVTLNSERLDAIEALYNDFEKAHFDALGNDPDKILENGKKQVDLAIKSRYEQNQKYDWTADSYTTNKKHPRPELSNGAEQPLLETGQAITMVKRVLKLHFDALQGKPQYQELKDYMHDYIITSPYTYTDTSGKKPQPEPPDFYNMPTSAATDLIIQALEYGANIQRLPTQKDQISHSAKYTAKENKARDKRQIIKTGTDSELIVEISDIEKLLGSNKPAKKIFVLALMKANEQAVFNGQLEKDFVTFPLQELVDKGLYKSLYTARKGFNSGVDALTSIKLKGHEKKKGKDTSTAKSDALEVMFTGARIVNGECYIFLNNRINWEFMIQYYTIIPPYYFTLPNRASDLLYYIFYLARQNTKKIEKQGYFTISFRSIQGRLQLPSEIGAINPGRDIKQPIEDAIEQIEDANSAYYHSTEFSLLPVNDDLKNISDFLDRGYLKVSLSGKFAEKFIEISQTTTKKVDAQKKRKERIVDNAKAKNLAEKMKST